MGTDERRVTLRDVLTGPSGLGVACVLLPVCAAAAAMIVPAGPRPVTVSAGDRGRLAFDQYLVNLGEVPAQPLVFARFEFTNRSRHTIIIDRLEPSCGCLQPELFGGRRKLAPGERGGFLLRVRTFGEAPGLHDYYCDVQYRDPQARTTRVHFRVRLPERTVQLRPRALIVYQSSDEPTEHTVAIDNFTSEPLQVVGLRTTRPWLRAENAVPAGGKLTVEQPEHAFAVHDAEASAAAARLRPVPDRIDSTDAAGEDGALGGSRLDGENGSARQFVRVVISGVPSGTHDGSVIIETSHPRFRRLTVPVRVYGPADASAHETAAPRRVR